MPDLDFSDEGDLASDEESESTSQEQRSANPEEAASEECKSPETFDGVSQQDGDDTAFLNDVFE
jgi:hypothetical protein